MFFSSQCEQVFYSKFLGKRDWSFIDPRGRPIKHTLDEEDDAELEQEDGLIDKDYGEYEPDVGDNAPVLDDDIDENMLENDIDEYDDNVNPFNIVSKPDDDINLKLDE